MQSNTKNQTVGQRKNANRETQVTIGVMVLLAAILFIGVPYFVSLNPEAYSRYFTVLAGISLLSIAASGVWLTFYIGRINIGQGVFCLFGSYISGILVVNYGVNFWYSAVLAGLVCAALSFVIGLPILRLRGVYFAMVTLISTEVAKLIVQNLAITKYGRSFYLPLPEALTIPLTDIVIIPAFTLENSAIGFYFTAISLMLLTFIGLFRLVNSRIGNLCKSLQQNEELASSLGVNIVFLRLIAYAISCFAGGVAGAFYGAQLGNLSATLFKVEDSINFLLYCFMGGLNYVFGPMVGTLVLRLGWDALSFSQEYQLLIYALILIALMFILPNGLLSIVQEVKKCLKMDSGHSPAAVTKSVTKSIVTTVATKPSVAAATAKSKAVGKNANSPAKSARSKTSTKPKKK